MAERRMFAKTIIDSDAFLEMPISSQCLYFHLSMRADDEGFINKPKTIMRMIGAKDDDMNVLITRKFIIPFESGVVVIKHWKIHNYIRGDRLHETKCIEEKSELTLDVNNAYEVCQSSDRQLTDSCHTEVRLGKDRLGKDRLDKKERKTEFDDIIQNYTENEDFKRTLYEFIKMRKTIKAPMTSNALGLMLNKLDKLATSEKEKIMIIEQSIMNSWKGVFPLKTESYKSENSSIGNLKALYEEALNEENGDDSSFNPFGI